MQVNIDLISLILTTLHCAYPCSYQFTGKKYIVILKFLKKVVLNMTIPYLYIFYLLIKGGKEVRQVSCGSNGLWAVLGTAEEPGVIGLRCGVTEKASCGVSWNFSTSVSFYNFL
jgi:hypothetical protein